MIKNTNDGTHQKPYLRIDLNIGNCNDLPDFSNGPRGSEVEIHEAIKKAGFRGIQDGNPTICRQLDLNFTAHARINQVGELNELISKWTNENYDCATLHVGWGMESDSEIDKLLEYILNTSVKNDFPLYLETHRSTITQDMQRTVEMVKRFPEVRFNGDFSHYYTGQEMVYGGFENKLNFIQPIIERVRFMHARIGNPGSIQVDIADGKNQTYVDHFKEMWIRAFVAFLKSAAPGDYISFNPELLQSDIFYARVFKNETGNWVEEGDRWQQALLYTEIANQCWNEAKKR